MSSPSGSVAPKSSVPWMVGKTTVRSACAVAPFGLTATTLMTVVPPESGTEMLKALVRARRDAVVVSKL